LNGEPPVTVKARDAIPHLQQNRFVRRLTYLNQELIPRRRLMRNFAGARSAAGRSRLPVVAGLAAVVLTVVILLAALVTPPEQSETADPAAATNMAVDEPRKDTPEQAPEAETAEAGILADPGNSADDTDAVETAPDERASRAGISGQVVAEATGEPVSGAEVWLVTGSEFRMRFQQVSLEGIESRGRTGPGASNFPLQRGVINRSLR